MIICCENDPEIINETNPVDETDPIALDLDLVRWKPMDYLRHLGK